MAYHQHLNLYKNNPTSGDTDGSPVSIGDNSDPITFVLDASINEEKTQTFAARCEAGYQTATDTTLSIASDTANHWSLSLDGTNWSTSVSIANTIDSVNTCFYVKANSNSNEDPQNDTEAKIKVHTKIAVVS